MNIFDMIELAVNFQKNGHLAEAEEEYFKILEADPDNKAIQFLAQQVQGASKARQNGTEAQKYMLDAFKKYQSHYSSVPPYNLNWMIKELGPIEEFLKKNPFSIFDIGARGGNLGELENLTSWVDYYGFDADADECSRINGDPPARFHSHRMLPYFLGKDEELIDFYLYKSASASSKFLPNNRFSRLFKPGADPMASIEKKIILKSTTLDAVMDNENLPSPDFIKLDTQGTELEILQASLLTLNNVLLIESEIQLLEIYDGQPLLPDFLNFMSHNGFEVLYLNRVFKNRASYNGSCRGQIICCDVLFAKKEIFYKNFPAEALARHAILLINYGHIDIAKDLFYGHEKVRNLIPDIQIYFNESEDYNDREKIINYDKSLCWQLHHRRTNQMPMDSDRSWPFR